MLPSAETAERLRPTTPQTTAKTGTRSVRIGDPQSAIQNCRPHFLAVIKKKNQPKPYDRQHISSYIHESWQVKIGIFVSLQPLTTQ